MEGYKEQELQEVASAAASRDLTEDLAYRGESNSDLMTGSFYKDSSGLDDFLSSRETGEHDFLERDVYDKGSVSPVLLGSSPGKGSVSPVLRSSPDIMDKGSVSPVLLRSSPDIMDKGSVSPVLLGSSPDKDSVSPVLRSSPDIMNKGSVSPVLLRSSPDDLDKGSVSPVFLGSSPGAVDKGSDIQHKNLDRSPSPDFGYKGSLSPEVPDDRTPSPDSQGRGSVSPGLIDRRSPSPDTPDMSSSNIQGISRPQDSFTTVQPSAQEPLFNLSDISTERLPDVPQDIVKDVSSDEDSEKDRGLDYLQREPSPDIYKAEISSQLKTEPFFAGDVTKCQPEDTSKSEALYSDDISKSEALYSDDISKSEALFSDDFERESSTTSDVTKEASPIPEIFQKDPSPVDPFPKQSFGDFGIEKYEPKHEATLGARETPYEPQRTPEPELLMDSPRWKDPSPERTPEPDYPSPPTPPPHKRDESDDGQNSPFEHIDPEKELDDYFKQEQQVQPTKEAEFPSKPEPPASSSYKQKILNVMAFNYGWLQKLPTVVLDLIYWHDTKKSGAVFGAGMTFLLLLRWMSLISVVSYMSLATLTATLSFRIYKNVMQAIQKTQDGHPFKEFLEADVTIPAEKVHHTADLALQKVNNTIEELRRLFLVEDFFDSLKFGLALWCCTYVGAWFNSLTLIILAYAGLFSLPKVYEVHQVQIDQYLDLVRTHIEDVTKKIRSVIPVGGSKEKAQ